jgi:hypothetical protein
MCRVKRGVARFCAQPFIPDEYGRNQGVPICIAKDDIRSHCAHDSVICAGLTTEQKLISMRAWECAHPLLTVSKDELRDPALFLLVHLYRDTAAVVPHRDGVGLRVDGNLPRFVQST